MLLGSKLALETLAGTVDTFHASAITVAVYFMSAFHAIVDS